VKKFIRKHFLNLLSVVLSIGAIAAAYHILYLSRPIKALEVTVDPPISLVDVRPEAADDIEVGHLPKKLYQ